MKQLWALLRLAEFLVFWGLVAYGLYALMKRQ